MKTKNAAKSIVRRGDTFYLMKHDDFRFGTANYTTVAPGRLTAEIVTGPLGHRAKVFIADNGDRYAVFSDWSARKL